MSEKTTQEFAGPDMKSRVDQILAMDLTGDDGEDISFGGTDPIPSPYLSYTIDGSTAVGGSVAMDDRSVAARGDPRSSSRPKTGKRRENGTKEGGSGGSTAGASQSSRPKSAARRREGDSSSSATSTSRYQQDDYKSSSSGGGRYIADEDQYPTARGLIKK